MSDEQVSEEEFQKKIRCSHGNIILGCPHDDCPEQSLYLHEQDFAMRAFEERQREALRRLFGRER